MHLQNNPNPELAKGFMLLYNVSEDNYFQWNDVSNNTYLWNSNIVSINNLSRNRIANLNANQDKLCKSKRNNHVQNHESQTSTDIMSFSDENYLPLEVSDHQGNQIIL